MLLDAILFIAISTFDSALSAFLTKFSGHFTTFINRTILFYIIDQSIRISVMSGMLCFSFYCEIDESIILFILVFMMHGASFVIIRIKCH